MATFSRPFADLSRYQQAAVQPQANVLDQFVQALNQGISLAQLPQTLQAEAQQRQQSAILNAIKVATAQKQFEELNKTPEQRLFERFQENLIAQSYDPRSGVGLLSPDQLTQEQLSIFEGGVPLATPGALTPMQQIALDEGGVRTNVPLGTPVAPMLTPRGAPTQFSFDPTVPAGVKEKARAQELADIEAKEAAEGRGRIAFEKAKIEAEAKARKAKDAVVTPLRFEKVGNTVIAFDPFTSKEISRTTLPAGFSEKQTDRGLFVGIEGNADSFKLVPGTEPIAKDAGKVGAEYQEQRIQRNLESIKELKNKVSGFTVGVGSLLSNIPGTAATDFESDVNTLKANIAFSELQAMRDASKTGGALGQVAVRELELLESTLGSLNTKQSKENFNKNLDKIQQSLDRWNKASGNPTGASFNTGRFKVTPLSQ